MGDMGRGRRSSKVRSRGKKVGAGKVPPIDQGVWEEAVRKNAGKKVVEPCDRCKRRVRTTKRKGIPIVEGRKRGGKRICKGAVEEGVYLAIKVIANSASIFCREER